MSRRRHPNQSVMIAVDIHGTAYVLSALGDEARSALDDGCDFVGLGFDEDDHPTKAGVSVWTGTVTVDDSEGHDELLWEGTWRPALLADFERFGLAVPGEEQSS